MRSSFIIIVIVMFNMSIFSCTTSDITDEIGMEEVATEGEDGETTEQGDENS